MVDFFRFGSNRWSQRRGQRRNINLEPSQTKPNQTGSSRKTHSKSITFSGYVGSIDCLTWLSFSDVKKWVSCSSAERTGYMWVGEQRSSTRDIQSCQRRPMCKLFSWKGEWRNNKGENSAVSDVTWVSCSPYLQNKKECESRNSKMGELNMWSHLSVTSHELAVLLTNRIRGMWIQEQQNGRTQHVIIDVSDVTWASCSS
jgi:hypothetical protein